MKIIVAVSMIVGLSSVAYGQMQTNLRIVSSDFIFTEAPFRQCHATTIAETPHGLVAAWFGGPREGDSHVGIWLSRREHDRWLAPVEVATGVGPDGARVACWNPVLFELTDGPLLLFYKVGPSPSGWWGMVQESSDGGATWSPARRLPQGILGPIKNKPVQLPSGELLAGSSTESAAHGWQIHFERSSDRGKTWTATEPIASAGHIDAIQPSILFHGNGRLQAIGRTRSGKLFETWSTDTGHHWSKLTLLPLANPNSGTDAVTLADGRQLLVYNDTSHGRSPLNVTLQTEGKPWQPDLVLEKEPGEYSYPAVIQTADGLVHITYTWRRERVKHVVVDYSRR